MKWFGDIAYSITKMVEPGVYHDELVVKQYFGEICNVRRRDQSNQTINNNFTLSNEISVLSDPFLAHNFTKIAYITFMGNKWKVNSAEVNYPRITLTLGDVYNDEVAGG